MKRKMRVEKLINIALDAVDILFQMDFDQDVRAALLGIKADLVELHRKVVG